MTTIATDEAAARAAGASDRDIALIRELRAKAAEFSRYRAELNARGPAIAKTNNYDLMVQYGKLVERADSLQAQITKALAAVDSAFATVRQWFGLGALQALGFVWLIPVAIIAAAVAGLGVWITDYLQFARKLDEQKRIAAELVASGVSPSQAQQQAAAAVSAAEPSSISESIAQAGKVIVGLGIAWFALQWFRGRG